MLLFRSVKTENREQSCVDSPLLLGCCSAGEVSEPSDIDGADLLDENSCPLAFDLNLWPERSGTGAHRGGCDEHYGAG